ncbi:site-specific DNA-methyltransferase [Iningainema tapete]|uniref:Site-specific DNA-methyltransferase n=1 Tax=Iningainema tapete BLCC-T55 TaxID=2748662 RepID=A0A8J6XDD2_9CYAN|nr:site-specific DNA-methyltransferase [Iningainema tapete]MBD2773885.1 site-specific DNA-methyltransferase [Iningainema tapete BLCC-T55]
MTQYSFEYTAEKIGNSTIVHADCFSFLSQLAENSIHAVVTDPPYGVKEYDFDQLVKRANGNCGIWRIPPSFDGHQRAPLPRFTALTSKERQVLKNFFVEWATLVVRVLRPGGHVFIFSCILYTKYNKYCTVYNCFKYVFSISTVV